MLHRFSVGSSVQGLATAAAVFVAVAFAAAGAARAEPWQIYFSSSMPGLKVDIYDVNTGGYLARDQDISNGFTVMAEVRMGGARDPGAPGTHIRWMARVNDMCWYGQVCSTHPGDSQRLDSLSPGNSRPAGYCPIEGPSSGCD